MDELRGIEVDETVLQDTYNVFKINYQDKGTWLVTHFGFREVPNGNETGNSDIAQFLSLISLEIIKPRPLFWVIIEEEDKVNPGDIVIGSLSHHPALASGGFAVLTVKEKLVSGAKVDKR